MGRRLREYLECKDAWEVRQTAQPIKAEFDHLLIHDIPKCKVTPQDFYFVEHWLRDLTSQSISFCALLLASTPSRSPEAENPILRPNYLQ